MTSQQSPGARPPMMNVPNMGMMPPQGSGFPQGQPRPGFLQGQTKQLGGGQGDDQFLSESQPKGHIPQGQMSQGQMPYNDVMNSQFPKPSMDGMNGQGQNDRFGVMKMPNFGSGDGSGFPFGPSQPPPMFRHPPPPPNTRFPPPPNFAAPPRDGQGSIRPRLPKKQITPPSHIQQGNQTNFSHAPGTERATGVRPTNSPSQSQQQMQMPFPQVKTVHLCILTLSQTNPCF